MALNNPETVIAIDFGEKRVGIAIASISVRLPQPFVTLDNDGSLYVALKEIIDIHNVRNLVVGYPRGLDGQSTDQTKVVEEFVSQLSKHFLLPTDTQDEALTSQKAEDELIRRNMPYQKGDVDALAATYILEDWLRDHH